MSTTSSRTPVKVRTASLGSNRSQQTTEPIRAASRIDLSGHIYEEITILDFIKTVWGLDDVIAKTINDHTFTLLEDAVQDYERILIDPSKTHISIFLSDESPPNFSKMLAMFWAFQTTRSRMGFGTATGTQQ